MGVSSHGAGAGVSLGVIVAGLLINLTGKQWIDPVTSFLIIAIFLWGTWRLFTNSIDLALDAVPKHIKLEKGREFLLAQKGVENIHDLHIWAMSTNKVGLTSHLIMPHGYNYNFIGDLQHELEHEFGINHTTLQIENKSMEENCEIDC